MGARRTAIGPDGLDYVLTVAGSLLHQVELSRLATAIDSGRRRSHASAFGLGSFLREAAVEGPFRGVSPVRLRVPASLACLRVRGDRACLKRLLLYVLGRAASDGVRRPVELVAKLDRSDALLSIAFDVEGGFAQNGALDVGYAAAGHLGRLLRCDVGVARRGHRRLLTLRLPVAG
jgi:hypothetical protein